MLDISLHAVEAKLCSMQVPPLQDQRGVVDENIGQVSGCGGRGAGEGGRGDLGKAGACFQDVNGGPERSSSAWSDECKAALNESACMQVWGAVMEAPLLHSSLSPVRHRAVNQHATGARRRLEVLEPGLSQGVPGEPEPCVPGEPEPFFSPSPSPPPSPSTKSAPHAEGNAHQGEHDGHKVAANELARQRRLDEDSCDWRSSSSSSDSSHIKPIKSAAIMPPQDDAQQGGDCVMSSDESEESDGGNGSNGCDSTSERQSPGAVNIRSQASSREGPRDEEEAEEEELTGHRMLEVPSLLGGGDLFDLISILCKLGQIHVGLFFFSACVRCAPWIRAWYMF